VKFGEACNSFIPAVGFHIDNYESLGFTGINLVVYKTNRRNVTTTLRRRFNDTNSMHTFNLLHVLHVYYITSTYFSVSHTIFRENVTTTVQKQYASDVSCHATYKEKAWREARNLQRYFAIKMLTLFMFNPLNAELNPICYLLALLGAHHFLHVSTIRVKSLTFRLLMSYIYGAPILDVSRSHTTTHHSR